MRPKKLVLEGFASFREREEVVFDEVDLFAVAGPTGAGKSSILDAIGFALYGCVARYDDGRLVAPVICQGSNQARVHLEFTVGGKDYTAVRIVKRTSAGGATTAEARLECGDEVLAGTAAELTESIASHIIGLDFEQFTKCVMLPQGDFAQFLHAKGKERQDLLVRLLDVESFRRIRTVAGERQRAAAQTAGECRGRLDNELSGATSEALAAEQERLAALEKLLKRCQAEQQHIQEFARTEQGARDGAEKARTAVALLRAIVVPDGIADLGERLVAAQKAHLDAGEACETGRAGRRAADEALSKLTPRAELVVLKNKQQQLATLGRRIDEAQEALAGASEELDDARTGEVEAARAHDRATTARDALLRANAAYDLAQGLAAGDTCPVCGEMLQDPPAPTPPEGLDDAKAAVAAAHVRLVATQNRLTRCSNTHVACEADLRQATKEHATLSPALAGEPVWDEVEAALKELDAAEERVATARQTEREADEALASALQALQAVQREEREAWPAFSDAHATVASFGAPPPDRDSLAQSWTALAAWARPAAHEREDAADIAESEAVEAAHRREEIIKAQAAACKKLGIIVGDGEPLVAAAQAEGGARQAVEELAKRVKERDKVQQALDEAERRGRLAKALADALQANNFERWYLSEALQRLALGASRRLGELSGDQYALALNKAGDDFEVVDHQNADERRSVRTLSGGETFLASLSLALALADEVAAIAAATAPRLDALFLDEGFGTLDPETLETVARALDELRVGGRMVGLVTHVAELAARMPVQFLVRKEAGTSRVDRQET